MTLVGGEALAEPVLSIHMYLAEAKSDMSLSEGQGEVGGGSLTASLSTGQGGLDCEDPFGLERKQEGCVVSPCRLWFGKHNCHLITFHSHWGHKK